MSHIKLKVEGMTCNGCVKSLEKAFSEEPNISSAQVDLANKIAEVDSNIDPEAIVRIVEGLGFEAELLSASSDS